VAYTSNVTVTCSGFPFTVDDSICSISYIQHKPTAGTWQTPYVNGTNGVSLIAATNVITIAGAGTPFASGDTYRVGIRYQNKSYTAVTNSERMQEIDPVSSHYLGETLLSLTDIAQTTTGYGYIDMAGYRYITIQNETSDTTPTDTLTLTLEASCRDDGTAAADCPYQDVTTALTGAASYVDQDCTWRISTPLPVKWLRVKYVTSTGGGNDCDLATYVKKMF